MNILFARYDMRRSNAVQPTGANLDATCYNVPMRLHEYAPRPAHLKWLLDSDPAIRWQVMRDLTDEAPNAIAAERSRVATEGWGAQLLAANLLLATGATGRSGTLLPSTASSF